MLYYTDLDKRIYEMQNQIASSNNIVIVSGYVGFRPIQELCDMCKGVNITVIYGMYGSERISLPLHKALLDIQKNYPNITILP